MNAAEILVLMMKILFSKGHPNYSQSDYNPSYEKEISDNAQRSAFDYAVLDYYGEGRRENENFEADYVINPQDYGHTHFDYSLINMHNKDYLHNFDDDHLFAIDIQNQDYADEYLEKDSQTQSGVNDDLDIDYADKDVDDNLKAHAGVILSNDDAGAEMESDDEFLEENLKAQAGVSS